MNHEEICESFENAIDKRQQVRILAELTDTDVETVVENLRDAGLYVKMRRCKKCGKLFGAIVSKLCRECEEKAANENVRRTVRAKWIAYEVDKNNQRKAALLRQVALINIENERLEEGKL